ncbi:ArsR/SmtB family transcription factor [Nonomuraea purpurea]|uniref:ArsR/SmtB family transcription factor n=1 Tax=Nonomuraea purpurea TaxID=1849276 RepID=A0ABV8G0B7_9ACTN
MAGKSYSRRTLDANALKSFAHPLRLRIYELLDEHGPSTATRLAGLLGQNTGATSYHLRELARHGMIEIVPEMGRGKEKYWRIVPGGFTYGDSPSDPEAVSAMEFLLDDLVRQRGSELARWRQGLAEASVDWVDAGAFGRRSLWLTAQETVEMRDEVFEVLERYRGMSDQRAAEAPVPHKPSTGHVVVHFDVLPLGAVGGTDEPSPGAAEGAGGLSPDVADGEGGSP